DKEIEKLKKYWEENLSKLQIETPDKDMNTMLNIWNQYQCMQTFNWSRYASYYEAGIGRGMGFRDSCQDTLGFCHIIPKKVRQRIIDLASIQFEDGSTYHQYSPLTKKGMLLGYSDDPHWLVIAVANYIKETGDFSILAEQVPFAPYEPYVPAQVGHHDRVWKLETGKRKLVKATLYEHLKRGIEFSWKNRGPHGLPLSKFSDWNDCLNLTGPNGKAESVLVGQMLVNSCNLLIKLIENSKAVSRKPLAESRKYKKIAIEMANLVNKAAWDGEWYRRAYDDSGKPVGSKKCKEGKIYLETQPWAVMSGTSNWEMGTRAMDSVYKKLFSKYGIILQQPALTKYYPEHGEISTYPPGLKENASIFCHPNPWAMIAECMLGRGDRAFEYYKAILPASQNEMIETRKIEPYVYCQMIAGKDHPDFGEGKNSWLTGSAAWNFYAASQYILGIRPEYDGIIVDPCIPADWKEFKVTRVVRGIRYVINFKRGKEVEPCHGMARETCDRMSVQKKKNMVKLLKIDGEKIEGNLIPYKKDRKEHYVEVILG
ncbi:MAG: glycosyl transferase, partial [Candidatus Saganbacteria bacterium]|nr:glycosyl transferase [Candidatus Saganbacteria bacterium]